MKYQEEAYISPEELKKQGFIRRKDGTIYKRNALEMIYEETSWLKNHFKGKKTAGQRRFEVMFNALNRFSAGKRLIEDKYKAGIEDCRANDYGRCKVDGHGAFGRPEAMEDAEDRYIKATRAVPVKYRQVLRKVCAENKMIFYTEARELRIALDYLIKHYLKLSTTKF